MDKNEQHAGELPPRVGSMLINPRRRSPRLVKFYNGRGTHELWILVGKAAGLWARLSGRRFMDDQARWKLFVSA